MLNELFVTMLWHLMLQTIDMASDKEHNGEGTK